jgi:phage-related minor tail protein
VLNLGELVARMRVDKREFDKGLKDGERKFEGMADRITGIAAVAGIATAAAFGLALVGAMSEQDVGAKVAAQLGHSAEEAGRLGHLAGKIYSGNFGESVADVGDVLAKVMRANLVPEDAGDDVLQKLTQRALTLRDVAGQDVTKSIKAVEQMMRNGLAPSAEFAFDIITRGVQEGVDKSEDLLDTFNEYGTQFRELGLNAHEALGLMSQGLKAGARDSDTVADALKEFAIRAKDGSSLSRESFKAIGLNADQMFQTFAKGGPAAKQVLSTVIERLKAMKDPVAQDAAAIGLFGTKAEDMQDALFALDPSTATRAIGNLEGATQRAADTMGSSATANLESFKRQLEVTFVQTLGGVVLPAVMKVAKWMNTNFGPAFKSSAKWIKENKEWLGPLAVTLGTFAGIIGIIVGAMKIWTAITAAYTVVQWALNGAMVANPIGLVVIAIAALVAGLIYAYHHSETFRKIVDGAFKGVATAAIWLWDTILKPLWELGVANLKGFGDTAQTVAGWVGGAFEKIVSFAQKLRDGWFRMIGGIADVVADNFNRAVGMAKGGVNGLIDVVNKAIGFINSKLIGGLNKIPGVDLKLLPSLPRLARGGTVHPSSGGRPVVMGDGGEVEYGIPHSDMERIIDKAVAAAGGEGVTVEIVVMDEMRRVRKQTRIQGGRPNTVLVGG